MSVDSYWGMGPNMFAGLQIIVHRSRRISTNRSQYCCSYISPSTQLAARINSESGTSLLFTIPCGCKVEQQGTLWTALGHWQFGSRTWHFWRRHGWAETGWNRPRLHMKPTLRTHPTEASPVRLGQYLRLTHGTLVFQIPGDFVNSTSKRLTSASDKQTTSHIQDSD